MLRNYLAVHSIFVKLTVPVIELDVRASIEKYIEAANQKRVWDREARLSGGDV
jgi:hypothetical protein